MENHPRIDDLAKMIDHALLHPAMTDREVAEGCEMARDYAIASACVKPCSIPIARELLAGTGVLVCTVVGFPHGNATIALKRAEASAAAGAGAREIDMVVNIGKVKSGGWAYLLEEIGSVNDAVRQAGAILKVIFETGYLATEEIVRLCGICSEAGAAFVKTSTGFGYVKGSDGHLAATGATLEQIRLMRRHSAPHVGVKASGGIRNLDDLLAFRAAGADRIGTSATKAILNEALRRGLPGGLPRPHLEGAGGTPEGY